MKIKRISLIFLITFFLIEPNFKEFKMHISVSHATTNKYGLSTEDIKYIQKIFKKKKYKNILDLPLSTPRPKVTAFFKLLKTQSNEKWMSAYLFLLKIVPEIFIEDELGC